ncbi:MAG: hypothetical protein ACJAUZ_000241 [Flavobacteriaceae bacterium]|jgi:hypothetical protein
MALGAGDLVNTTVGSVAAQLGTLSVLDGSYVKVHALNEGSQAINAGRVPVLGAEDSQGMREGIKLLISARQNQTQRRPLFTGQMLLVIYMLRLPVILGLILRA